MMINDLETLTCSEDHRKIVNEFNFLSQIQPHPNIFCLLESFQCVPTDEMINSMQDLCLDKNYQFYILEEYWNQLFVI